MNRLAGLKAAALHNGTVGLIANNRRSVHAIYRYPARFSPEFAGAAISAFSDVGDLVVDPYCGGGTTALEASRLGRQAFASDLSPLAVFLTRAKGRVYSLDAMARTESWAEDCISFRHNELRRITRDLAPPNVELGALDHPSLARIRVALAAWESKATEAGPGEDLARLCLLRCGQRLLDLRVELPRLDDLRRSLRDAVDQTIAATLIFHEDVRQAWRSNELKRSYRVAQLPADKIDSHRGPGKSSARLALLSPPYPGVHVLYPRWQIQGRRESSAPFWLAGVSGDTREVAYTMGRRGTRYTDEYMAALEMNSKAIARVLEPGGHVVQMVGFKDARLQLPQFLDAMSSAGFVERRSQVLATSDDGRLWRHVPGQRWYTAVRATKTSASREVVLIHRLRKK